LETVSAHSTDAEEMEAQTDPVTESEHVSSPLSCATLDPPNLVAESAVGSVSQISSDPKCEVQAPEDIPLPEEMSMDEAISVDVGSLTLCDLFYQLEYNLSGSGSDSSSVASTTSIEQRAADLADLLLQVNNPEHLAAAATLLDEAAKSSAVEGPSSLDH
jgi:hypothetical protein